MQGPDLRIEPVAGEGLTEVGGRLVIPASGAAVDDALVRALRDDDRCRALDVDLVLLD